MSNNNQSNIGFWMIIAAIGSIVVYFWREVLSYILDLILTTILFIKDVITELIYKEGEKKGTLYYINKNA